MASLSRIERMKTELEKNEIPAIPNWISGRKLYEISGPDNSALGCHFSGLLRQVGNMLDDTPIEVIDENQNKYDLSILLHEAAERMDDAHEDWLETKMMNLRRLRYDLN